MVSEPSGILLLGCRETITHFSFWCCTDNQLTGPFPDFFVNMTSLYALLLNRNLLTGPIPSGLDNLQNLRLLYVDRNSLTGSLEDVCTLGAWSIPDSENFLAADCGLVGGVSMEVNCTCCTHCCTDGTDEGCHENFVVPNASPLWENGYDRSDFDFGNETSFEFSESMPGTP